MMSDFFQPSYWPTNQRLKMLTFLLFDVQTHMRGQIGVEFKDVKTVSNDTVRTKVVVGLLLQPDSSDPSAHSFNPLQGVAKIFMFCSS